MPDIKVFNIVKTTLLLLFWAGFAMPARAQMPSLRISVENLGADTGSVWFDVFLEQGSQDEVFLGNAQVVFTLDTSVFDFGSHQQDSLHLIKPGYSTMLDFYNDPFTSPFWVTWGKRNNQDRINLFVYANQISNTSQLQTMAAYLGSNGRQCLGRVVVEGYQGGNVNLNYAKRVGATFNSLVTDVFSFETTSFDQLRALVEYNPIPPMGGIKIDARIFLEGPFNASTGRMETGLNLSGAIPLSQPYGFAPFNYPGLESVSALPDSVVDWVLIEVRKAADVATAANDTSTSLGYRAVFITEYGRLLDTNLQRGVAYPNANYQPGDSIFIVIRHRNHLGIMSGVSLKRNASGNFAMELCGCINKYYLNEAKELVPGVFGMAAGDLNHDGRVQSLDRAVLGSLFTPSAGYYLGDIDMDGFKDQHDVGFLLDSWAYVLSFALK